MGFVTDSNRPNRLSNRFWGRFRGPFPSNAPLPLASCPSALIPVQAIIMVVPVAVLAAAVVVTVTVAPARVDTAPCVALSVALYLVAVLWVFAASVWQMRRLVLRAGDAVLRGARDEDPTVDALVRYVRTCARDRAEAGGPAVAKVPSHVEVEEAEEEDPLHFMRHEIADKAHDVKGYTVIDTSGVILWCNEALLQYFK